MKLFKNICAKDAISQAIPVIQLEKQHIPGSPQADVWAALQLGQGQFLQLQHSWSCAKKAPDSVLQKPFPI